MYIQLPQIIWLALLALHIGVAMAKYGEPKNTKYDIVDILFGPAISFGLLWWGGFFAGG